MSKRWDFSFLHVVVRLLLVGVMTVVFGIAMFPFMRVADGLLYEQKAAIGGENIWRIVILWAIYTALFSVIAFWKKRFRMVAVFLIVFWVLGIGLAFLIEFRGYAMPVASCRRSTSYTAPPEVNRALDLIAQRLNIENNSGTYYGRAFAYRNCLDVRYSEEANSMEVEGFFVQGTSSDQLKIALNPQYKSFDDLSIATVLIHELTHVGQYLKEQETKVPEDCYLKEAEAFTAQSIFMNQLNDEERRSIYTRLQDNQNTNPALQLTLDVETKTGESYNACLQLKAANSLTDNQFNECVWTGTTNKMLELVKNDKGYIKQCSK